MNTRTMADILMYNLGNEKKIDSVSPHTHVLQNKLVSRLVFEIGSGNKRENKS